jgi:hypothetical protein
VAVTERAKDIERLDQVAAGRIKVAQGKLGVPEVAEDRPDLPLVADLTEEPQRLGKILRGVAWSIPEVGDPVVLG